MQAAVAMGHDPAGTQRSAGRGEKHPAVQPLGCLAGQSAFLEAGAGTCASTAERLLSSRAVCTYDCALLHPTPYGKQTIRMCTLQAGRKPSCVVHRWTTMQGWQEGRIPMRKQCDFLQFIYKYFCGEHAGSTVSRHCGAFFCKAKRHF